MKTKKALKLILPVILLTLMCAGGYGRGDDGIGSSTSATKKPVQLGYIPPAWSLKLPASKRFESVLDGEAVLDRETGLVWEKSWDITATWNDAVYYAYNKNVGGRGGWRLPTVEELRSLIDPTQSNPALPSGHPFINALSSYYWTSTTQVGNTSDAWLVNFSLGDVSHHDKSNVNYAWCVRGGQGYDAY